MNKYQKALNFVKAFCPDIIDMTDGNQYHIDVLQELVDRAKPMKLYTVRNITNKICPSCHLIFSIDELGRYEKNRYCHNCGQKLDWEDENQLNALDEQFADSLEMLDKLSAIK